MTADDTDSDDELPSGWEERATGQGWVYYTNHVAKTTQWEHPVSGKRKVINCRLPYGWETQLDKDGNVYFVDHVNGRTTYADPRLAYATEISPTSGKKVTFSSNSSAAEVLYEVDLKGKVALITGGSSGIGFETAKELAFRGCHVLITSRSDSSGKNAVEQMKLKYNNLHVEHAVLDLNNLSSVSSFANRLKLRKISLNILVLNAGVFDVPYSKTVDQLETTFAVNFLSHAFLVLLLLPLLVESTLGRVIFVAAESHRFHNIDGNPAMKEYEVYSNPDYKEYMPMLAYNRSKLLMILFCRAMQQRLSKLPILAISVHPGNLICTGLYSKGQSRRFRLLSWLMQPFNKTVSQAAATSCYCATALEVCYYPGAYFNGCRPVLAAIECDDVKNQEFIWSHTLHLIKEKTNLDFNVEKGEFDNMLNI